MYEDKDSEDEHTPCPSPRAGTVGLEMIQMGPALQQPPTDDVDKTSSDKTSSTMQVVVEENDSFFSWRGLFSVSCCVLTAAAFFLMWALVLRKDGDAAVTTPDSAPVAVSVQTVTHQAATNLSVCDVVFTTVPDHDACMFIPGSNGYQHDPIFRLKDES